MAEDARSGLQHHETLPPHRRTSLGSIPSLVTFRSLESLAGRRIMALMAGNKVAFMTGAGSGIGRTTTELFAQQGAAVVQKVVDRVTEELRKRNRLEFRFFGIDEIMERKARMAQRPKTFARISVPATRIVKFKAGRKMKIALNGSQVRDPNSRRS